MRANCGEADCGEAGVQGLQSPLPLRPSSHSHAACGCAECASSSARSKLGFLCGITSGAPPSGTIVLGEVWRFRKMLENGGFALGTPATSCLRGSVYQVVSLLYPGTAVRGTY